jgi:hypothetical protein
MMGIQPKSKKLGLQHENTKAKWTQNYIYNFWALWKGRKLEISKTMGKEGMLSLEACLR